MSDREHTEEEHVIGGSLMALGKMLHDYNYPLDKALKGLKLAYEIAALPALCTRKDRCAEVVAFGSSTVKPK